MKCFHRLHPVPAFCFFAVALLVAMLTLHPVVVSLCWLSGVIFCGMLIGLRKLLGSLAYSLPLTVLIALTNPLFVHRGETTDSMRARGYGLRGRTGFAIYRFTPSDVGYLVFTALIGTASIVLIALGAAEFSYYPVLYAPPPSPLSIALFQALALLTGAPIFMEVKENILWHYRGSNI